MQAVQDAKGVHWEVELDCLIVRPTTSEATLEESDRTASRLPIRNGLHALASLGVPDGALTALLVVLASLTVLPYVAGREFGPYSVSDVLPGGVFWTLTLLAPPAWVALMTRSFGQSWRQ